MKNQPDSAGYRKTVQPGASVADDYDSIDQLGDSVQRPGMRINLLPKKHSVLSEFDEMKQRYERELQQVQPLSSEEKLENKLLTYSKIARGFYEGVNFFAKNAYLSVFPLRQDISKEDAAENRCSKT